MNYGMDTFTTLGLFYLMISPLPDCYSFDAKGAKGAGFKVQYLHGFIAASYKSIYASFISSAGL